MKSNATVAGLVTVNGALEFLKHLLDTVEPLLQPLLTLCQILVAIFTVIYIFWKIKTSIRDYRRK